MRRLQVPTEQYELAMEHAPVFVASMLYTPDCFGDQMGVLNAFSKLAMHLGHNDEFNKVLHEQQNWQQINMQAAAGHVTRDESLAEKARIYYMLENFPYDTPIERYRKDSPAIETHARKINHHADIRRGIYANALEAWQEFPESDILSSLVCNVVNWHERRGIHALHALILSRVAPIPEEAYAWTNQRVEGGVAEVDPTVHLGMFYDNKDPAFITAAYKQLLKRYSTNSRGNVDLAKDARSLGVVVAESRQVDGEDKAEADLTALVMSAESAFTSDAASTLYDLTQQEADEYAQDRQIIDIAEILAIRNPIARSAQLKDAYTIISAQLDRMYRGTPKEPSDTIGKSNAAIYAKHAVDKPVQDATPNKKWWKR